MKNSMRPTYFLLLEEIFQNRIADCNDVMRMVRAHEEYLQAAMTAMKKEQVPKKRLFLGIILWLKSCLTNSTASLFSFFLRTSIIRSMVIMSTSGALPMGSLSKPPCFLLMSMTKPPISISTHA